jgi:transposase
LSKPLMQKLGELLSEVRALPESGLAKAVEYTRSMWLGLLRFLDGPRIPLDNNATERALRGIVAGRKSHYGSRSKRGTEVAALFYSLVETAKLSGVNPLDYLRTAVDAALRGEVPPPPHELAAPAAGE